MGYAVANMFKYRRPAVQCDRFDSRMEAAWIHILCSPQRIASKEVELQG